jgi:hypothetical protein
MKLRTFKMQKSLCSFSIFHLTRHELEGIVTIVERILKERLTATVCNAIGLLNSHHYLLGRMKTPADLKMSESCPQDV